MTNFHPYAAPYPDSGSSSPRSREIDFENSGRENSDYKVKLMCSYGGKIQPRAHDNQLSYTGGETKILSVDRSVKFGLLLLKLAYLSDNAGIGVSFKYQLPGEDLDALISVTNGDDLEHMMIEYDRLHRLSPNPARLRIFLFPPVESGPRSFGSDMTNKSEKDRFMEALNSDPIQAASASASAPPPPPPAAVVPPPRPSPTTISTGTQTRAETQSQQQTGNVDFLFGLEKEVVTQPPQPTMQNPPLPQKVAAAVVKQKEPESEVIGFGLDSIQKHIQDLQKLRLEEEQQQQTEFHRRKSEENSGGKYAGGGGDYLTLNQKLPEKATPVNAAQKLPEKATPVNPTPLKVNPPPVSMAPVNPAPSKVNPPPVSMAPVNPAPSKVNPPSVSMAPVNPPANYWPEKPVAAGGTFPASSYPTDQQQLQQQQQHQQHQPQLQHHQIYMIPGLPASAYHHGHLMRPIPGPAGQGYYTVQRLPDQFYRDQQQQQYNVAPPPPQMGAPGNSVAPPPPTIPLQQPNLTAAYRGVAVADTGYPQMAYEAGRPVYFTPGGMTMMAGPTQGPYHQAMAGASGDVKAVNKEGGGVGGSKAVPKVTQTPL